MSRRFLLARRVPATVEPGWATMRRRRRVAQAIDSLALPISRPQLMLGPPLTHLSVASAALPHLLAVQPLLRDPGAALPADIVEALWRFLTDGRRSPLFDDFPDEARQHAYWLSTRLVRDCALLSR